MYNWVTLLYSRNGQNIVNNNNKFFFLKSGEVVGQEYVECRLGPTGRMVGYTRLYLYHHRGGGTQWGRR